MVKFFVKNNDVLNDTIILNERESKHLQKVLRMKVGEQLLITVEDLKTYVCKINSFEELKVSCKIISEYEVDTETKVNISLFQCIAKFDKMDYIIQKATELGVKEIYPVLSDRVIVKLDDSSKKKKVERWQQISNEAAKQSKRNALASVENVIFLKDICNLALKYDIILLAYENDTTSLKAILSENKQNVNNIAVVIGPEGGFEQKEIDMMLQLSNVRLVSLGKRILRTETSSNSIISIILYEFDEI